MNDECEWTFLEKIPTNKWGWWWWWWWWCVCVCVWEGGGWMAWGWEGNGNVGLATFLKKIPGIFRFATLPSKNSGQNKLSISFTSTSAVVTASNELSNIYNWCWGHLCGEHALTKNFCHAKQILDFKGVGRGVSESVKKGKFVMKIFFSDNAEWSFKNLWKMISADVKANKNNNQ